MKSTKIFAAFLFLLCVFLIYNGWEIHTEYSYEPLGPKPFPIASLFLIAFCAVLLFFFAEDTDVHWGDLHLWKKLLIFVSALFIFAAIFEYLGFIITASCLIFAIALLFEAKLVYAFIFAVIAGVGFYFIFENLLQITLPFGLIFEKV